MGIFSTRESEARPRVGPWSIVAIAILGLFIAWLVIMRPDERARQVASDLVPLSIDAIALVLAVLCIRDGRTRRARWAWALIATSYLFYLAGDSAWAFIDLVQEEEPFLSVADWFYLAFYPAVVAGLLMLPGLPRKRNEWGRVGLDILTVTIAGAMTIWYIVLGPTLEQESGHSLSVMLSVAYPVGDLVLILGIATVMVGGMASRRSVGLRWMAVGAGLLVVTDVAFAHLTLTSGYDAGSWPDIGWMLAVVCFVVAADRERRSPGSTERRSLTTAPARVSLLPYMAIASSFALLIHVGFSEAGAKVRTLLLLALGLTATVVARQVTAVRDGARLTDKLQRLAATDPLTSLSNRRHLIDGAGHEFTVAQGDGGNEMAVIFIDVDHFKSINDFYGHAVGDAVLVWLGVRLRSHLREQDLVGRFGGDEFVAVMPGANGEAALAIAARLERAIATTATPIENGPPQITLSIGVATSQGCDDLESLLARADGALYQAKRSGRSRACLDNGAAAPPTVDPVGQPEIAIQVPAEGGSRLG